MPRIVSSIWLDHSFESVFYIDEKLCESNADEYYNHIDAELSTESFRPRALFDRFGIEALATTEGNRS